MTQDLSEKALAARRLRRRLSPEEDANPDWIKRCNPKTWSQSERDSLAALWKRFRVARSRGELEVYTTRVRE
ncbi:hypothetical protein HNR56_003503 [Roseospira marina]|nr:hypothetical protein [Roseospira marina]MBB5088790.1 hypothetical protein [Roseospira marina]